MKLIRIQLYVVVTILYYFKNACTSMENFNPYAWRKGGRNKVAYKHKEEINTSGTFIVDYCTILTPEQAKLARLFVITSKMYTLLGMPLLDACHIVYTTRNGYFGACTTALELTVKNNDELKSNKKEICQKVREIAIEDEDIKSLVNVPEEEVVSNQIKEIEMLLSEPMDRLGGTLCSNLSEDERKAAKGLVLILLKDGYDLRINRACACFITYKDGSLEDCAKTLQSSLHNRIELDKAQLYCVSMIKMTKSYQFKEELFDHKYSDQVYDKLKDRTKEMVAVNEALLVALAIDNRCYLDPEEVKMIVFSDFPHCKTATSRMGLFDRFKKVYTTKNRVDKAKVPVFPDGVLTQTEILESQSIFDNDEYPIELSNDQSLRTLYITYRNLMMSVKETEKLLQDMYFQRRNIPASLKKRFYIQMSLVRYMEMHIGNLNDYISQDKTDIIENSNSPTNLLDLRLFGIYKDPYWKQTSIDVKKYVEMDHFLLFCTPLHRSAFRLSLIVLGLAHSALKKTKVKLPDVCLAILQIKPNKDFRFSFQLGLSDVFVTNQNILEQKDLDSLFHLSVAAVNESVDEFLLGAVGDLPVFRNPEIIQNENEGKSNVNDKKIQRYEDDDNSNNDETDDNDISNYEDENHDQEYNYMEKKKGKYQKENEYLAGFNMFNNVGKSKINLIPEFVNKYQGESLNAVAESLDNIDDKVIKWLGQVERRVEKIIDNPKQILKNLSLLDVDMIMQSTTKEEAKLQLLINIALKKMHYSLIDLTHYEEKMRHTDRLLNLAIKSGISSDKIEFTKVLNEMKSKYSEKLLEVIDNTAMHAKLGSKAVDIFDIADRPFSRKVHRLLAVYIEYKRISSQLYTEIQNAPTYKTNKHLLKVSIMRHRKEQAYNTLYGMIIGPYYDPLDLKWYTDFNKCNNAKYSDLSHILKENVLKIDPSKYLSRSTFYKNISDKKSPQKYSLTCSYYQISRYKRIKDDIKLLLLQLKVPQIDLLNTGNTNSSFPMDILSITGWSALLSAMNIENEHIYGCTIAKEILRKFVSDITQKVKGGSSFMSMPLMHLWCADHIRFRRKNEELWRHLIGRIWLIFIDEPLNIPQLINRKWRLLSWFR